MNPLGELLGEIEREAAALPTGKLRTEIQVHLGVLAVLIDTLQDLRPEAAGLEEMDSAKGDVLATALVTALYVRELTTRPGPRFARVRLSFN
jgi:hypothetical protein